MTKQQHIHKLKRLRYKSGNEVFFCTLPDCSFKSNIALSLGKRSICHRCGEPFIMTEYSLRLAKPHCDSCHKPKNQIPETLDELLSVRTDELIPIATEEIMTPILKEGMLHSLTLAERLQATINSAKQAVEQDEEI